MGPSELLPCPFCGADPIIGPWGDAVAAGHEYATAIECGSDLYACPVNPAFSGYTFAETVAAWNRRTPPAQAAESVQVASNPGAILSNEVLAVAGEIERVEHRDQLTGDTLHDWAARLRAAVKP